ncbi:MAG: hypothetical protein O3B95_04835 [Chloroflexi bacterium]|nr:hypothetical protein [Chloroflexota bacterium]
MSIRNRLILVLIGAFVASAVMAACGGPTTTDIVETSVAQNKIDNATATAQSAIAAGIDPDNVQVQITKGSAADLANQETAATATAQAEAGIFTEGVGSTELLQGAAFAVDIPDGPAQSGTIEVAFVSRGAEGVQFDPAIVKVRLGSTVRWSHDRRSASSTTADPGQDDFWDSGSMSKGTFATESASFEHVFNVVGCFTYRSEFSGDAAAGAVCVVDE